MSLHTKTIPASHLARDPDIADWLFEVAALELADEQGDPLNILMQREAAGEYHFHDEDGVQYPYFAPSSN